jgi:spermidine dehydrogenase
MTSRLSSKTLNSNRLKHDDKALGMEPEHRITRRDFLNAALLASGSALLNPISPTELWAMNAADDDWTGYGGVGDYAKSNGNTTGVMEAGHQIRDGVFERLPANLIETGEFMIV